MKGRLISIRRERLDHNTVEETITIHYKRPMEAASAVTELGIDEEDVHFFDDTVRGKALILGVCAVAVVAMAIGAVVYG